jgi:hypothetical protein
VLSTSAELGLKASNTLSQQLFALAKVIGETSAASARASHMQHHCAYAHSLAYECTSRYSAIVTDILLVCASLLHAGPLTMAVAGDLTSMSATELTALNSTSSVVNKALLSRLLIAKPAAAGETLAQPFSAVTAGGDELQAVALLQLARLSARKISNTDLGGKQAQLVSASPNFGPAVELVRRITEVVSGAAVNGGAPAASSMCRLAPEIRR